jgi:hypothetical protein
MEAVKLKRSPLSLRRQCVMLCIPRSSLYYAPIPEKPENLKMMTLMGYALLTSHPTGSFMYMTAYTDVYSRKIMGWGISNSMSKQWCLDVLETATPENGVPEIINSD